MKPRLIALASLAGLPAAMPSRATDNTGATQPPVTEPVGKGFMFGQMLPVPAPASSSRGRGADRGPVSAADVVDVASAAAALRGDRRHGTQVGLTWSGARLWAASNLGAQRNRSSWSGYSYEGLQADLGVGRRRGRVGLNLRSSGEWRRYQQEDGSRSVWRYLGLAAEATCRLAPNLRVFVAVQRGYGYQDGQPAFAPWSSAGVGVRMALPFKAASPARRPAEGGLRPRPTARGWLFRFEQPNASFVHLIGTFSQWNPQGYACVETQRGVWEIAVPLDAGIYEYAFCIDGKEWVMPPGAPAYVDDGSGRLNGVLVVGASEQP